MQARAGRVGVKGNIDKISDEAGSYKKCEWIEELAWIISFCPP